MASNSTPQDPTNFGNTSEPAEQPTEPDLSRLPDQLTCSLCIKCEKRRLITSGTGAIFLLCGEGLERLNHPKYPPQPVASCAYFSPK